MEKQIDATQLLMDKDIENILLGTYGKSRSVLEISQMYGIAIATCFWKVRKLRKMGLLEVKETIYLSDNRKSDYYTACLDNAYVFYDSGKLKVRFKVVLQMANDFRRRYEQFTEASSTEEFQII